MKRLALLLALAVSAPALAQSEWFARTGNRDGGEIVLLTSRGQCPEKFHQAFAADPAGRILWGCWVISSTHVHVVYENGWERAYQQQGWAINPIYQQRQQQQPQRERDRTL